MSLKAFDFYIMDKEKLPEFLQWCQQETKQLKTDLSTMPLHRRLNILEEAGLIERQVIMRQSGKMVNKAKRKEFYDIMAKFTSLIPDQNTE